MLNHIIFMGRLTRDVEMRVTNNEVPVATFCVACERDFAVGGEKQTDFIDVVAWRGTADFAAKYFHKGSMIVVSGALNIRNYTDKDGNKRKAAEVVADHLYFAESKRSNEPSVSESQPTDSAAPYSDYADALGDFPF